MGSGTCPRGISIRLAPLAAAQGFRTGTSPRGISIGLACFDPAPLFLKVIAVNVISFSKWCILPRVRYIIYRVKGGRAECRECGT